MNFSSSLRRENSGRFIMLLATVGVLMSLMVIFAQPAQAHHPILGVGAVCNVETGDIEVTWSLANGNWNGRTMTVDQVTYTDGTGGFSNIVVGNTLGPNASTTDVIVYPFAESSTKTLTVRGDWDKEGPQNVERSESIDLSKVDRIECQPPESKARIIVKKEVTGSDSAQSFVFTASYDDDGFSLKDGESDDSGDLAANTYSVSEAVPAGWDLVSTVCESNATDAAINPDNIALSEGETVICTFTNREEKTPPPTTPTVTTPPAPLIESAFACDLATSKFVVSASNIGSVDVLVGIGWDSGNTSDDLKPGEVLSAVVPAGENWTIFEENVPVEQGTAESCDEVSPTSITATTAPEVSPETLPFTGAESGTSAALALVLVAGGALALVGARSVRAADEE